MHFFIGDREVLDRLFAEREEDGAVEAYGESRDPGADGELGEPARVDLEELAGEGDVFGVVAAEDEFEPAVRDQTLAHVGLLCCGDDRFAELAYLACEARRDADFSGSLAWEDVVSFVEDEDVLELLAWRAAVL